MSNKDSHVPLLTTPGGAFFVYSVRRFHKLDHKILSSRSFKGEADNQRFDGNIFPFSENLLCTYFGESLGKLANKLLGPMLFSRLFIANIYFTSDLSLSTLSNTNDQIKIKSEVVPSLKLTFKKKQKYDLLLKYYLILRNYEI